MQLIDGNWIWFTDPRAISVGGVPALAVITGDGHSVVYEADDTPASTDLRGGSVFQVDDHAHASLLVRSSDSKILAFASIHNGSGLYTYLSTNANDVTAFGAETNIDAQLGLALYTYTNPVQLTDETDDPIYLFFRGAESGVAHFQYSKSTDQGSTWAAATRLISNNGVGFHPPYVKLVQNGNGRIDFFCTDGHPQHQSENSIYHFYYEGGNFKDTGGSNLTLPIEPATDLTPLYDGTTTKAWIWDCAIDGSGNPVCVYATFPSTEDHRYRYAKWNGASWDDNEICTAGGRIYPGGAYASGGVTIDHADVSRVFASRETDGVHEIWRHETSDGGATWDALQITANGEKSFRPIVVRGQASEPKLSYVRGRYDHYTDYETEIVLTDSTLVPALIIGRLLIEGGTDALLIEGGSDALLTKEIVHG